MADRQITYPMDNAAYRGKLIPVAFTWNGSTVTASTQKALARHVASVVRTSAGLVTITFKDNKGAILSAGPHQQTANGTFPNTVMSLGTYNSVAKTLCVQANVGGVATDPSAATTVYVNCYFSADARD